MALTYNQYVGHQDIPSVTPYNIFWCTIISMRVSQDV